MKVLRRYVTAYLVSATMYVTILAAGSALGGWLRAEPAGLFGPHWGFWLAGGLLAPVVVALADRVAVWAGFSSDD